MLLVNFDAHSDATSLPNLGGPLSERIQSYSWLSPLMPEPFSQYLWVVPGLMDDEYKAWAESELQREMSRGPVVERFRKHGGSIASHTDLADFPGLADLNISDPVVVSIDLDFFTRRSRYREDLIAVLRWTAELESLQAVTVAVSPVYLPEDPNWMYQMLETLFEEALRNRNWSIRFEPFIDRGRETSRWALEMEAAEREVPRLNISEAPPSLIRLWALNKKRISVEFKTDSWKALLDRY
ncbi:MAG: hypothetical protein CSA76_02375 [Spirochaetales bacterium]|nr:MAG: hypothetical protein CSA76_02375 [Spirochaetales bacterium]